MLNIVKTLAPKLVPSRMLFYFKGRYYTGQVKSFWESDLNPAKALVAKGDTVIDIGANVGWYTAALSQLVGENGKVYSIEPIPETFRLLEAVTGRLQLKNVQLYNCALSEEDGSGFMRFPLHNNGQINFYRAHIVSPNDSSNESGTQRVTVRSLDSLFANTRDLVSFIKCDVEGHELAVFYGAKQFLNHSRPALLVEIGGDPDNEGSPAHKLIEFLQRHQYSIWLYDGKVLRKRARHDWSVNYFFLQAAHIEKVSRFLA